MYKVYSFRLPGQVLAETSEAHAKVVAQLQEQLFKEQMRNGSSTDKSEMQQKAEATSEM